MIDYRKFGGSNPCASSFRTNLHHYFDLLNPLIEMFTKLNFVALRLE